MRRAAATAMLLTACAAGPEQPNYEFLPEMVDSLAAYDTFAPNPNTPDGKTILTRVPGTIARGRMPLHFGPGPAEAERAGRERMSPIPESPAARARGERVFKTFCAVCHGAAGEGDGPVIGKFPMPPSLVAERAKKMPDGQIWHVITFGQGLMASYAAQVEEADRWKVVQHLRALQAKGGAQ
jgi:mono/diheme cytochrome c family protein